MFLELVFLIMQRIDYTINQFIIIDKVATATGSNTLTFNNHRFVKKL